MTEKELVKKCIDSIARKNGFSDSSRMVHRDFELLCAEIENSTGVLISVSTIKRLLNSSFARTPQIATLNAIATYLGYRNWQQYKMENKDEPVAIKPVKGRVQIPWKWVGMIVVFVLAIIVLSFLKFSSFSGPHFDKAKFSAVKTTANSIPNTVIFNYDVKDVEADSFFIQQSWDRDRRVKVSKDSHTLTDIYFEPGYHTAKLIANDSVIRTFDVSIPTGNWFFYSKDNHQKGSPEYIKPKTFVKDGCLVLTKKDLDSSNIKTDTEKTFVYSLFPDTLNVTSDNYILKTRIKTASVVNNQCPYIMVEVFCQKNFMYFLTLSKGCASEARAQFGEKHFSGKENDLSLLGADVNEWMEIVLTVKNRQVNVLFDNKPVFAGTYNNPSGLITGLGFISNGLCQVDYVDFRGMDGQIIYKNEFEK